MTGPWDVRSGEGCLEVFGAYYHVLHFSWCTAKPRGGAFLECFHSWLVGTMFGSIQELTVSVSAREHLSVQWVLDESLDAGPAGCFHGQSGKRTSHKLYRASINREAFFNLVFVVGRRAGEDEGPPRDTGKRAVYEV